MKRSPLGVAILKGESKDREEVVLVPNAKARSLRFKCIDFTG